GRARYDHLLRRGMGAVRLDVRRHRLLRRVGVLERPHAAGDPIAPAQGPNDGHRGRGRAMSAQTLAQARSLISRWYSIPLLLLVWQVTGASGLVESRLLPSPGRVWTALATEVGNGTLIYHAGVTGSRALAGFLLAALVGIPFAGAMARSPPVRNLFEPIFFLGYPIPQIALVSLFPLYTRLRTAFEDRFPLPRMPLSDRVDVLFRLSRGADAADLERAKLRRKPIHNSAAGHFAGDDAEHFFGTAGRAAGGDHR